MKKTSSILIIVFAALALPAANAWGLADGTVACRLKVGELMRTYNLHVPANLPKDRAAPLVLMFHGGGGTPEFAERESKFSELADRKGFLVAYPSGTGKSWNDGRGIAAIAAQHNNVDDVAFISALLDEVIKTRNADPRRVYATGISNGGIFSHYLGARLPSRFAAIAPVAAGVPESLAEQFKQGPPLSILIIHGTADPLVPFAGGEITIPPFGSKRGKILSTDAAVKLWVDRNGCRHDPIEENVADTDPKDGCTVKRFNFAGGRQDSQVTYYRIDGGGHTWPGGLQYLPERTIGHLCRDFSATEVIWDFFEKHASSADARQ